MADDPTRQAYLARLRTAEGVKDFGTNYFTSRGSNPYQNPFAREALKRAQAELPLLSDLYNLNDVDLEGKLGQYFSGEWNPSGRDILAERDRLGGLEGSIFATGDTEADQQMWQAATGLGRADLGANWMNAYGQIEQKRAGEFNSMLAQRAGAGNPWQGFFSGWRQGLPQMAGTVDTTTPGGGAPAPGGGTTTPPATTPPAVTPPATTPGTPPPGTTPTTPPAATTPFSVVPQNGVAIVSGGTPAEMRNWFLKNRSGSNHPDAPGTSSFRIGPYLYTAPKDTARQYRDENGNTRYMGSGFNKLLERADLLVGQGVAKDWYDAMIKSMEWIMTKGPGFGFTRVA